MLTMVGSTDIGQRSLNEDCFLADPGLALAVVADGMGGHQSGEVASAIVVATLEREAVRGNDLSAAIQLSHSEVKQAAREGRGGEGMGTAVVAALFNGSDYDICWVGDCRGYLWDGELVQLTRDHSHVEAMLSSDSISWEEAQSSSVRNLITQAVGVSDDEELRVGSVRGRLGANQELLLCSDGLNDVLSGQQIGQIMNGTGSAAQRCEQLVATAVGAGGRDNTTALIVVPDATMGGEPASRPSPVSISHLDGTVEYFTASGRHVYNNQAGTAMPVHHDAEKTGVRMVTAAPRAPVEEEPAPPKKKKKKKRGGGGEASFLGSVAQGLGVGLGLIGLIVLLRWLWTYLGGGN